MSYYDTIEEDLARAKAILAKGKPAHDEVAYLAEPMRAAALGNGGAIWGADIYVAYKLLESFVAEIERLRAARSATGAVLAAYHDAANDDEPDR